MEFEAFLDEVRGAEDRPSKKEVQAWLGNKSFRGLLKVVVDELDAQDSLLGVDLNSEQGLADARTRKGNVNGLTRALQILFEEGQDE